MSHAACHGSVSEPRAVQHPLDPLTADEIRVGYAVLAAAGRLTRSTRFPQVLPVEPAKDVVASFKDGDPIERRILFTVLDTDTGESAEAVVSVTENRIVSWRPLDTANPPYGQPQYLFEEYDRAEAIVKASPQWQAAMARRGLADRMEHAFCSPLAPGFLGRADEAGRRVIRSLTFLRDDEDDSPWAHPVEGLIAHVDLTAREVIRLEDEGDVPVPAAHGRYDAASAGPARASLKPIEITQPDGPSFHVDGSAVTWENWTFRVGFNAREGLVLNQVAFRDGDEDRSVLHRASVPEMVVPYGDTSPTRFWISYFDAGEYLLGKNANSLELGCDCLGVIHYFDAFVADDQGNPVKIPQAVCMHEEDYGILWKHTDLNGRSEVRRSRRLVISYFATVGNYDYGFYWYFYLDGTIELEAKATGIVFAGAGHPGEPNPHAPEIAPGIFAPVHQHLFCARLDVAVDGAANSVYEVDVEGIAAGPENPHGNAFTWQATPLRRERDAQRMADPARARVWEVRSAERTNRVGRPTCYQLVPKTSATLMARPESSVYARATFATKHLWATAYHPDQRFPAGDYPNAHAGGAGLPAWTAENRSLEGTDIVLWHVFGPTHIPRPEDWPVMPVDYSGFAFKPYGFLDQNPALDVPDGRPAAAGASDACHCGP
ncbi:primary-amine oxidase [Actinobacteria bacterium YIM 96077]|uniref:Amine oxidase n=1 Tax=Phytoactinopolyspora halophila TaxID=1981511 RepID=A0A329QJF4_9ACTN|nr:primary-amine oxidase [Phytoactinopolyspora halophila]AYY12529.1 primary-amine oxidase [Actinobacteria bacterium YIM 96077]RAW12567.1 tyramine oxidase [Phytoactinopolyspora halophila]